MCSVGNLLIKKKKFSEKGQKANGKKNGSRGSLNGGRKDFPIGEKKDVAGENSISGVSTQTTKKKKDI